MRGALLWMMSVLIVQSILLAAGLDNDQFASRISLSGTNATFTAYHFHATTEPGEPAHAREYGGAAGSLWWSWTAADDGFLRLDMSTTGPSAAIDVYTGDRIDQLERVGGGASFSPLTNLVPVKAGTTYQMAVCVIGSEPEPIQGGYWPVQHQLRFVPKAPHDNFEDRARLRGEVVEVSLYNVGATFEAGEPDYGAPYELFGSTWHEWSSPVSGYVTGSDLNGALHFFRGSGIGDLRRIEVVDGRFTVDAGEKVFISVASSYLFLHQATISLVASSFRITSPSGPVFMSRPGILDVRIEGIPTWATNLLVVGQQSVPFFPGEPATVSIGALPAGVHRVLALAEGHPSFGALSTPALEVIVGSGSDPFADAPEIDLTNRMIGGAVGSATVESGEPPLDSDSPNRSGTVWWRWTPPVDGVLRLGGASPFDEIRCDMYQGTRINDLVAENVPYDGIRVFSGTNYWFRIWRKERFQGAWVTVPFIFQTRVPNDDLANFEALALTGAPTEINRGLAYPEPFEEMPLPSQWFGFTSPGDGQVIVRADSSVPIYRLESNGVLTRIGNAPATISVRGGESFRLPVYTWPVDGGPGGQTISARFALPPANDFAANAIRLPSSDHGRVEGTTEAATADGLADLNLQIDASVWYRFVAPYDGTLVVMNAEVDLWPDRVIFATRGENGELVTMPGQVEGGVLPHYAAIDLRSGVEVWICIGFSNPANPAISERFVLEYSFASPPDNDAFANRSTLEGTKASAQGILWNASTEAGEPVSGHEMHRTAWWTWQAPADGMIRLKVTNATVRVYTGNGLPNLVEQTRPVENSTQLFDRRYAVTANTQYHICVDLETGSGGDPFYRSLTGGYRLDLDYFELGLSVTPAAGDAGYLLSLDAASEPTSFAFYLSAGWFDRWIALRPLDNQSRSLALTNLAPAHYHVFAVVTNSQGDVVATPTEQFRVAPKNDLFQDAIPLFGRSVSNTWAASGATLESRDQAREGESGSVWFRWIAPAAGSLRVSSGARRNEIFSGENASVMEMRDFQTGMISAVKGRQYWVVCYTEPFRDGQVVSGTFNLDLTTTSIAAPIRGSQFNVGQTITIRASTSERPADVASMTLRSGTNDIAVLGAPLWTFLWTNAPVGSNGLVLIVRPVEGEPYETAITPILIRPKNTNAANAIQLTGRQGGFTGIASTVQESVWYRWTSPANGFLSIQMPGRQTGDGILLWKVDAQGRLTGAGILRDDDDQTDDWLVSAGQNYLIEIRRRSSPGGSFPVTWSLHDPPLNDDFSQRIILAGNEGQIVPRLFGATFEAGEIGWVNKTSSAWWSWSATASGILQVDGDAIVYRGSTLLSLTYQEPSATQGTLRTYFVASGDTLHLGIYGWVSDGDGSPVRWRFTPSPPNDHFSSRIELTGESFQVEGTVQAATYEAEASANGIPDVWWTWTAPRVGTLVSTSSSYDGGAQLTVLGGDSLGSLQPVPATTAAGQTYVFRVFGGPFQGTGSNFNFGFRFVDAPANDLFANRLELFGSDLAIFGTTLMADREVGEPIHGGIYGGASVWYEWVPAIDGRMVLAPENEESRYTTAAVYTGDSFVTLSEVASAGGGEDGVWTLSCPVTAGQNYKIAVDSRNGAGLLFDLRLRLTTNSVPSISILRSASGGLNIAFGGGVTGSWRLERSLDLVNWERLVILNESSSSSQPVDYPREAGFFRLVKVD